MGATDLGQIVKVRLLQRHTKCGIHDPTKVWLLGVVFEDDTSAIKGNQQQGGQSRHANNQKIWLSGDSSRLGDSCRSVYTCC